MSSTVSPGRSTFSMISLSTKFKRSRLLEAGGGGGGACCWAAWWCGRGWGCGGWGCDGGRLGIPTGCMWAPCSKPVVKIKKRGWDHFSIFFLVSINGEPGLLTPDMFLRVVLTNT